MRAVVGVLVACVLSSLTVEVAHAAVAGTPYAGFTAKNEPVVVQVAKDGRSLLQARAAIEMNCSNASDSDYFTDSYTNVPLSKRGTFTKSFRGQSNMSDGRPVVVTASIRGKIDRRQLILSGTWRLEWLITQPDGSKATCTSGAVTFKAYSAPRKKPAASGYYGAIARGNPIVIQVAADGRSIRLAAGGFQLKCPDGLYYYGSDIWQKLPISATGRFQASVTDYADQFSDGSPFTITASLSGTLDRSGRRLRGTWRVAWTLPNPDGTTEVCDSGPVPFSVVRSLRPDAWR